jgi:hypothetical protein
LKADRYVRLDSAEIIKTVEVLSARIGERFPASGLREVCDRLVLIARHASQRSAEIGEPILWLRAVTVALALLILISFTTMIAVFAREARSITFIDFVQSLEAGIGDLVFIGAAVLFLVTFEGRVKRRRALKAIHELRSLAHIIDMHQLTKDPERILFGNRRTATSPKHNLSPFELDRYLDYCSEMLALIGKIAALYVQNFQDSQAVEAVNDIEQLTSGLARKIWQKIMILHDVCGPELAGLSETGRQSAAETRNKSEGPTLETH